MTRERRMKRSAAKSATSSQSHSVVLVTGGNFDSKLLPLRVKVITWTNFGECYEVDLMSKSHFESKWSLELQWNDFESKSMEVVERCLCLRHETFLCVPVCVLRSSVRTAVERGTRKVRSLVCLTIRFRSQCQERTSKSQLDCDEGARPNSLSNLQSCAGDRFLSRRHLGDFSPFFRVVQGRDFAAKKSPPFAVCLLTLC